MSATVTHHADLELGIIRVDLAELIALRARAGKPGMARIRASHSLAGGHASALRGRGMDYAESRVYQPGDDARNIDWRRTARSGKWHTKLFEVERERSLLLMMDTHATMRLGTRARFKSVAAARAAAWVAWTCVRGGDRIGAMAFGVVRAAIDPHAGTRGALNALGALVQWDGMSHAGNDASEPLSVALVRAQRLATPGNRVWLLSDGWCVDDAAAAALSRMARHVDLRVVIVVDALESGLAPSGSYVFETGSEKHMVDLSREAARAEFRERLSHGRKRLAEACDAVGAAWTTLATTDEPDVVLAPFWRKRDGRP